MAPLSFWTAAILGLVSSAVAQCGSGSPQGTVTGNSGAYVATAGGRQVYSGSNYLTAITTALNSISSGQRVSVIASGSIGANSIFVPSGKTFEGCGTIDATLHSGRGAIESYNTRGASIPYLKLTGSPYFGMRFYGTKGLKLGTITMNLSSGLGIRFERDKAGSTDVTMGTISVGHPCPHQTPNSIVHNPS